MKAPLRIGFAMCGSFCTFDRVIEELRKMAGLGWSILPIMSDVAYNTDTRFGKAEDFRKAVKEAAGCDKIIHTITEAEPIGPKHLVDVVVVAPCTGNTLAKLAMGITDSPVTMAVKSHLRNCRPVVIAISSNDSLAANAKNIGILLNTKNIYFVPFGQDNPEQKVTSIIADMSKIIPAVEMAVKGLQLQPLLF